MPNGYPNRQTAEATLQWAEASNPGRWILHSHLVANAAEAIGRLAGMDAEKCYVLALLHDIGRYPGRTYARHLLDGYRYCMERGWTDVARVCLTHSFPVADTEVFVGWHDVSAEERAFVEDALHGYSDDYDRLIQLCDSLAAGDGYWILEKRWIDVTMRYGWTELNPDKWRATLAIKRHFDQLAGRNIYELLPDIAENSLKDLPL